MNNYKMSVKQKSTLLLFHTLNIYKRREQKHEEVSWILLINTKNAVIRCLSVPTWC
jgi:hypothetical protein